MDLGALRGAGSLPCSPVPDVMLQFSAGHHQSLSFLTAVLDIGGHLTFLTLPKLSPGESWAKSSVSSLVWRRESLLTLNEVDNSIYWMMLLVRKLSTKKMCPESARITFNE